MDFPTFQTGNRIDASRLKSYEKITANSFDCRREDLGLVAAALGRNHLVDDDFDHALNDKSSNIEVFDSHHSAVKPQVLDDDFGFSYLLLLKDLGYFGIRVSQ